MFPQTSEYLIEGTPHHVRHAVAPQVGQELHVDPLAESTVASIFATFSTIMNAVVRARLIPVNPCYGVRVTAGAYETEYLVATPTQALRAAMRLYETMGLPGFVLCLLDFYTGARWGELVGQQPHEYDPERRGINIRTPLLEVSGVLTKGGKTVNELAATPVSAVQPRRVRGKQRGRTKTPAGTRLVELPPSIAVFYELLIKDCRTCLCSPRPKGSRCGGRTSGSATGGRPGTASMWTTPHHPTISLRSCPGSPSMKDVTPTPPG
ncbi:hypothetical protein KIPE111705_23680 [Kibdelosporangium persicum]|uniref:Uncharacterized protein n=1 Tax=Kibdelosporangium persicum TaxID=2698649 RepID=A0ABX2F4M7_9PSEU|nr:hypothetical protein [Kibdelosporangium persicum]NRN65803.1 hypothetical protein [Kibdelosporangium persicum]